MTAPSLSSTGALPTAQAQLTPGRDEAGRWAREELADPGYAEARPGLVVRVIQWVLDRLGELGSNLGGSPGQVVGSVLLVALLVLAVLVVLHRSGALRRTASGGPGGGVFGDRRVSADEHRRRAAAAETAGHLDEAVRELFRATVRALEERALLDERPGRTADEVAVDAGTRLPALRADLVAGARAFDDVTYGGRRATAAQVAALRALDHAAAAARASALPPAQAATPTPVGRS